MEKSRPVNTFKIMRVFLIVVLAYLVFTNYDMDHSDLQQSFEYPAMDVIGQNEGLGNFIGIQPAMNPIDYASDSNFYNKLDFYLNITKTKGLLTEKTIVVLPEHLGTWLVAAMERKTVYTTDNVEAAMRAVIVRNILGFLPEYLSASKEDKSKEALFRLKSTSMGQSYSTVLKALAKKYSVTIVGGSIILPNPIIDGDSIIVQDGPLYNTSFVFYSDGTLDSNITKKSFLVTDEQCFLASAKVGDFKVYDTEAGKLAVTICADSWYPEVYDQIKSQGATLLAIPSYSTPSGIWTTKWQGYNGAPNPSDVDKSDINSITEEMAWLKYGMGGRAQQAGIQHGMNVFLRGDLWDLGDDGKTISWQKGGLKVNNTGKKATITCMWF